MSSSAIVVFSGGSAANSLVDVFEHVREASGSSLSYVIPISDNGGSSSEIIRVFGGPGIGDVRSRLVRLIPDSGDAETLAIKHLFNHRLPAAADDARSEWFDVLEARHALWATISSPKRELIRSYLNNFHLEAVRRMRPGSRFNFSRASLGNLFLTGARLFTGSFEAAIYLFASICALPDRVAVLPALETNFAHHIAAGLRDGSVITGQNDISHPSSPLQMGHDDDDDDDQGVEDANLPGSLPALRRPAIDFCKDGEDDLPARIDRVWYINPYGHEIHIPANPRVLDVLSGAETVIYSIGSLFTSVIPSVVLRGVGDAIANPRVRNRVLILNGTNDRETGPSTDRLTAVGFVAAIAGACADSRGLPRPRECEFWHYVTHVLYMQCPGAPEVDRQRLAQLGIDSTRIYGTRDEQGRGGRYDGKALGQALETIVGRKKMNMDRSRRNTLVG
ncbi:hypothetical protein L249_6555 [Ophiocordyceps polyrhachis-furcata BCC 54312]|uniref:Uncharacterized protein n=1 Tax=Ophiocordyceps polyrhachis-furcata BCC 54312 TaxID=1330021 RepID=A0A367LLG4_9HYPO|nr:hypothetical protein L249_6555 [Ophiocordyceps polyrhachis-furcata BCC 54312]